MSQVQMIPAHDSIKNDRLYTALELSWVFDIRQKMGNEHQ